VCHDPTNQSSNRWKQAKRKRANEQKGMSSTKKVKLKTAHQSSSEDNPTINQSTFDKYLFLFMISIRHD
jgi:hypothetical protein